MELTLNAGELARIFFKDGQNFFGILLNDPSAPDAFENEVRFVKSSNYSEWVETSDEGLVEVADPEHVDGIDLYLK